MSRGNPITLLRLPPDLLRLIDEEVIRQNAFRPGEPYTRSSWIRQALKERLDHLARARRQRRNRRSAEASAGELGSAEASGAGPVDAEAV
jgi:hypothetical protein